VHARLCHVAVVRLLTSQPGRGARLGFWGGKLQLRCTGACLLEDFDARNRCVVRGNRLLSRARMQRVRVSAQCNRRHHRGTWTHAMPMLAAWLRSSPSARHSRRMRQRPPRRLRACVHEPPPWRKRLSTWTFAPWACSSLVLDALCRRLWPLFNMFQMRSSSHLRSRPSRTSSAALARTQRWVRASSLRPHSPKRWGG
jgi:hypothetical protein